MAHFAELDENNIVINVIVISNTDILDENGQESEALGIAFCKGLYGQEKKFVQTSYNHNFRKRYAVIGFMYDENYNAFIPPKPFPSWIFNEEYLDYDPPVPYPNDPDLDNQYYWDEEAQSWFLENIVR